MALLALHGIQAQDIHTPNRNLSLSLNLHHRLLLVVHGHIGPVAPKLVVAAQRPELAQAMDVLQHLNR